MAFHWWGERWERRRKEKRRRRGRDSGGCSVTLEEIRRLSSPLMTLEIVFQRGGNARAQQFVLCSFKSFLCQVQVASLSLFLSLTLAAAHCLPEPQERLHSVGWSTGQLSPAPLARQTQTSSGDSSVGHQGISWQHAYVGVSHWEINLSQTGTHLECRVMYKWKSKGGFYPPFKVWFTLCIP